MWHIETRELLFIFYYLYLSYYRSILSNVNVEGALFKKYSKIIEGDWKETLCMLHDP